MPNLWIEFIVAGGLAVIGLLTGAGMSRLGKRAALSACLCVVIATLALAAGWFIPVSRYSPMVFALVAGRTKFALLSFVVPAGLAAAMPFLPYRMERRGVVVMIALSIYAFAVFPFLGAAMAGDVLVNLPTRFDSNGICRQSTSFTCGPAAAVTALHQFGLNISEGRMAVLSRSCPWIGTSDYDLTQAICRTVSGRPVNCFYGQWDEPPKLTEHQVLLAMLRQGPWTNHCVVVLDATDKAVVFADPAEGLISLSKDRFLKLWTGRGILLQNSATR